MAYTWIESTVVIGGTVFGIPMYNEESVTRARYLMSPYNLREVRSARKNTRFIKGFILVLILIAVLFLIFGPHETGQKNDRVGDRTSQTKG